MTTRRADAGQPLPGREAEEIFGLAEKARDEGRHEDAARLFGRAAAGWGAVGKVAEATEAYFELGDILLSQGRSALLPDLESRLLELLQHDHLPPGFQLKARVFARLMTKGPSDPGAFRSLVEELRNHRRERRLKVADSEEDADSEDLPGPDFSGFVVRHASCIEWRFVMPSRRETMSLLWRLELAARSQACPLLLIIGRQKVTAWIPTTELAWLASQLESVAHEGEDLPA